MGVHASVNCAARLEDGGGSPCPQISADHCQRPADIGFGNDLDERPFRPGPSIEESLRDSPWNESHLIFGRDHWVWDQERVAPLARLCADGYSKQVMIAHDHCLRVHFAEHGGKGWVYTQTEVVPMLREAGVTEDQLNDILVENPKRIFAV